MKKLFLSLAITSAIGLSACGADGDRAPVTQEDVQIPFARVAFDPGAGNLPVPSDILLGGTTDGTLNIPVPDATDFSNPQNAINALDGWSTAMPLTFGFTLPDDPNGNGQIGIRASSVEAAGSVRVFKVVMGGDTRDSECMTRPSGTACKFVAELQHGQDFTVVFSGGQIQVIPLRPYEPKTGYIAALTDSIVDELGRPVRPSSTYYLLSKPRATAPVGADGSQESQLQGIINSYHAVLGQAGVQTDSVIYSSGFTTQSVNDVLDVTKQLLLREDLRPSMSTFPTGQTAASLLGLTPEMGQSFVVASAAQIYGGQVTLPYYSPIPSAENPTAPLNDHWRAGFVSPASIIIGVQSGQVTVEELVGMGLDPALLGNPAALAGQIPYEAAAGSALAQLDRFRHLTKFNPIPRPTTINSVPLWMSVPDVTVVNAVRAQLGMDPITMPAGGWPVVIFQHGITGSKENFLPIAGTLAVSGHAVVAIDHPLHGERGFEITDASGNVVRVINATTGEGGSPTDYLNLASLLTARDNLRQSSADLLGLRVGLNFSDVAGVLINPTNVKFVGHSLGAIAGTNFMAVANTPLTGDLAQAQGLFQVQAGSLGMPGGGIAPFLVASERFGPVIGGQIAFQSFESFRNYAIQEAMSEGIDPQSLAFMDFLPVAYVRFYQGGVATSADQAQLQATLGQFQFAAQTVVDSGDPINYAAKLRATGTPLYLIQANGDKVVPNSTPHPLGGTLPLIRELGLPFISGPTQSQDGNPISGAARYVGAGHSSLLNPADADANPDTRAAITQDMQQSIGVYFESGARILMVTPQLLQ
ncbi:VolA/Pla-1 family phospholipase [Aliidiomarina haloalkalitolerans]|uniref:Alpha/beta hydrolase n=1 Tax=Aliidiomarina haloalkalitolerans TaxID=859059 RepID=A0A432VZD3_9GAMM|nr:VolA/Pla-1 family phospholipase [Aliidiomarina haloalkalitolerans]RUO22044.1 alpha/beta hydrolase [Aliidiomarina haloalkalitolerans]